MQQTLQIYFKQHKAKETKLGRIQKNGVAILSNEFSRVHFIYTDPKYVSCSYFRSFVNH